MYRLGYSKAVEGHELRCPHRQGTSVRATVGERAASDETPAGAGSAGAPCLDLAKDLGLGLAWRPGEVTLGPGEVTRRSEAVREGC